MIGFRNTGGFLKSIVEKQYRAWKHEDVGYRAAFLGRMRSAIIRFQQENNKYPNPGTFSAYFKTSIVCLRIEKECLFVIYEIYYELTHFYRGI